jgi:hypothetical protein
MKRLFLALLLANLVAGAWLLLEAPMDVLREPGRMDLQLEQGRVRVLSPAEVARKRDKAQNEAAPPPPAAAPIPVAPPAAAPSVELPLASCIDIGTFTSESATKKIRARLSSAGLGEHVATITADKITRLRITRVDAAGEAQIHLLLHEFPKQEMVHCSEPPGGK